MGRRLLCALYGQNVVHLAQDPATGGFTVADKVLPAKNENAIDYSENDGGSAIVTTVSPESHANTTAWLTVSARRCPCTDSNAEAEAYYCPTRFSHCKVKAEEIPQCLVINGGESFVCASVPLICVWYATLCCWLVTAKSGRSVLAYVISCCYHKSTDHLARRMLREDPSLARNMIRRNAEATLQQDGIIHPSTTPGAAGIVGLRTKTLHSLEKDAKVVENAEDDATEEENHQDCAICFEPIENGDRVGDLPCSHLFHSVCLKTWLIQRQVCPLCQRKDVVEKIHCRTNQEIQNRSVDDQGPEGR